jgi:hypothetical protein
LVRRRVDLESEIGCKVVSSPNTSGKAGSSECHDIAYELADARLMSFYLLRV